MNPCRSINMVKDFKGQLAITKPEGMRAFLLTLSLEINVIGWKINDWMDRQTGGEGGGEQREVDVNL